MGIKILTVEKINNDSSYAGSVLFNQNRVFNDAKTVDTDDVAFTYAKNTNSVVGDKVYVSEALATFDDIYTAFNTTFYTLPIHEDLNDTSSSTTNRPIDAEDIAYGISLPSDATKCLLWIQDGDKVVKKLVDKAIAAIEDKIMTGSTTTTTTTAA